MPPHMPHYAQARRIAAIVMLVFCIFAGMLIWSGIFYKAKAAEYQPPNDYVRINMISTEAVLLAIGYGQADGYGVLPMPDVRIVDSLPDDDWGSYRPTLKCKAGRCDVIGALIKLSARQPVNCMIDSLMHEMAHDAAVRMGIVDSVPNAELKAKLEEIADRLEAHIQDVVYRPNCIRKDRLRRAFTAN